MTDVRFDRSRWSIEYLARRDKRGRTFFCALGFIGIASGIPEVSMMRKSTPADLDQDWDEFWPEALRPDRSGPVPRDSDLALAIGEMNDALSWEDQDDFEVNIEALLLHAGVVACFE